MGTRRLIHRLIVAAVGVIAALAYAGKANGVIVSGEAMAQPAAGWVGSFNGSSCVAVGKHCFVTARHVGGGPGNIVVMRGQIYSVTEVIPHPSYDCQIVRVAEELPGFHTIASGIELGDACILGGWGVTAEATLPNNAGYDWAGPHEETWGANTLSSVGPLLVITFDSPASTSAVPHEATFAVNDSGAGVFVYAADGSLELAGIAVSVMSWGSSPWGCSAFAFNLDTVRNWIAPLADPSAPVSSAVEAPRAMISIPGLPAWVGGLLLVGFNRRARSA